MNILIISEAFVGGGLETHIHTYYSALKDKHNIYFAFASFKNRLNIDATIVDTNFNFLRESSTKQFINDVENLVKIIQEKKIDIIHAHPFFSLFPAMIASQITKIPLVYTYHGIASFSFTNRLNDTILFHYGLIELVSKVFTVSNTGKAALTQHMHLKDVCFLPNLIDMNLYAQHNVVSNRCWAVISRLDEDNGKEESLKKLFNILPELNIERIDIYGDGTRKNALMEYASRNNLNEKVRWMGFQSDLYSRLNNQYNGIIGTDRVAIEGLAMGYPVIEMGYGRINGIIDPLLLEKAYDTNFDANILPEVFDVEKINNMLSTVYNDPNSYNFRDYIFEKFNHDMIAGNYIKELENISFKDHANISEFYQALHELSDKSENFYRSQTIFNLMKKHIEYYAVVPEIKNLFLMGNYNYEFANIISKHVNGLNWRIDNQTLSLNSKSFTFMDKLKRLIKRLIKPFVNRT